MKNFLVVISFCIFFSTCVNAADLDIKIVNSLDNLSCWSSAEKLINTCKKFLTTVQEYTANETSTDQMKAAQDDILLAAQVSVDASFNACQTILNVAAAMQLAMQNTDQATPI